MSDLNFMVQSVSGPYEVRFSDDLLRTWKSNGQTIAIIDRRVHELYADEYSDDLRAMPTVLIDATEESKSIEALPNIISELQARGVRRGQSLLAIGGGITQDITAFLSTTMFRGLDWAFIPTTLLAQSDSCIGSKSSINAAGTKNLLGTFRAPRSVDIDVALLRTLTEVDMQSGIGEMLKVHAIAGPAEFDQLASSYESLLSDSSALRTATCASLLFKRVLIEIDEFDEGPRNVMNYGHSFGHAIETATNYAIPHGIAVTIGMDMANFIAAELGISNEFEFTRMHPVLRKNSIKADTVTLDTGRIIDALLRDKKNSSSQFRFVLPNQQGVIERVWIDMDAPVDKLITKFLEEARLR